MITISLFQLAVLHILRPLESKIELKIKTFDECIYLVLINLLICFTDYIPDPEYRNKVGIAYISVMLSSIGFHLMIVLY